MQHGVRVEGWGGGGGEVGQGARPEQKQLMTVPPSEMQLHQSVHGGRLGDSDAIVPLVAGAAREAGDGGAALADWLEAPLAPVVAGGRGGGGGGGGAGGLGGGGGSGLEGA